MKILVVDDDRGFLSVLSKLLSSKGYEVSSAEEGKQARELLDVEQFDLIISDVYMPTLDGAWFHSYVREFSDIPEVPFVFMSAQDDDYTRNLIINPTMDFFIVKSLPPDGFVKKLESTLKKFEASAVNVKR
jgi:DNA-binding response OmpR family regulator